MTHKNYYEHTAYQRDYNKTEAGRARTRKYLQSARGKLNRKLRRQRILLKKQGHPITPDLYITHPMYNDPSHRVYSQYDYKDYNYKHSRSRQRLRQQPRAPKFVVEIVALILCQKINE